MSQLDIIDYLIKHYPHSPGFKERTTSKEAAASIDAKRLRGKVLAALKQFGPMSADEIAAKLSIDKLSIRPRTSELRALGKIRDSGMRSHNSSGKRAIIWAVTNAE